MKKKEIFDSSEKNSKQKLTQQENLFLNMLDFHIIQQIFIMFIEDLILDTTPERIKRKLSYKSKFENFISFALVCKTFNRISKTTKFEIKIFENQKIENIKSLIYLQLVYLKQIEAQHSNYPTRSTKSRRKCFSAQLRQIFHSKEELLNFMLIYSSKNGYYHLIKPLILNGANPNYENDGGVSLHHTCSLNYLKTTKKLVKYGSNINYQENRLKRTPLHHAGITNNLKLFKFLVTKGANIHSKNIKDESPLFDASYFGSFKIVKYLTDSGVNINQENRYKETILFRPCKSHELKTVKHLLDLGLNINHKDVFEKTCLYYTVGLEYTKISKYLITKGSDLKIKYDGKTLLEIVKQQKNPNIELIKELEIYI